MMNWTPLARAQNFPMISLSPNSAVVAKDVEPYTLAGGNPARPIRKRFDQSGQLNRTLFRSKPSGSTGSS